MCCELGFNITNFVSEVLHRGGIETLFCEDTFCALEDEVVIHAGPRGGQVRFLVRSRSRQGRLSHWVSEILSISELKRNGELLNFRKCASPA